MTRTVASAHALALCIGALLLLQVCACTRCSSSSALAVLTKKQRSVDRDFASKVGKWQAAATGARFSTGDGVKTGAAASAELKLDDGSMLQVKENTTLRFLDHRPGKGQAGFNIETGEATLHVGKSALQLLTSFGKARIEAGSVVRLRRSKVGLRYAVSVGKATLTTAKGNVNLQAGDGLEVGVGQAVIDQFATNPQASASASAVPPPTPVPEAATGDIAADVEGHGTIVRRPGESSWSRLAPGATSLPSGTTVRVPRGGRMHVSRGGQQATLNGSGQYLLGPGTGGLVEAQRGSLSLDGGQPLTVHVPGGTIVATQDAHATVAIHKNGTKVKVSAGVVEMKSPDSDETLRAGEQGTLSSKGGIDVQGRGPAVADFFIGAGGSVTVHDPHPPTALGIRFNGKCPGSGLIELRHRGRQIAFSRGEGSANVAVPAGGYSYQLHCIADSGVSHTVAARGRVVVLHDAGTLALPRSAPASLVDADGRRYTILYQNLLPQITVRWPNAPQASSYVIRLTSHGSVRTVSTSSPEYSFKAGEVREGTHQLTFSGGGYHSKTTTLAIHFDNAAPKASIEAPASGSFAPGSTVTVAGTALAGWKVVVGGKQMAMDPEHRFSGSAVAPTGQRALVIQLIHPPRGVDYYLRRSSGAAQ